MIGLGIAAIVIYIIFMRVDIICLLFGYTISSIIIGKLLGVQNNKLYLKLVLLQKILTLVLGVLLGIIDLVFLHLNHKRDICYLLAVVLMQAIVSLLDTIPILMESAPISLNTDRI